MADSRLAEGTAPGSRKKRSQGTSRRSRAASDRKAQNRELTDQERLEMYQMSFQQSVLPDLPEIPGYHVCWLTTTNPRDSLAARSRLGYTPVKPEDVPGYEYATVKTGEYAGCIVINEMVAYKLPIHMYQRFMDYSHHQAPASEERKLSDTAEQIREHARRVNNEGAKIMVGNGTAMIGKNIPESPFFNTRR